MFQKLNLCVTARIDYTLFMKIINCRARKTILLGVAGQLLSAAIERKTVYRLMMFWMFQHIVR